MTEDRNRTFRPSASSCCFATGIPWLLCHRTAPYLSACESQQGNHFLLHSPVFKCLPSLQRWCARVAGRDDASTLATAVGRVLLAEKSGDAAAMELYELLGDSAFEHISELMENRK